jgi:hypothetical protein
MQHASMQDALKIAIEAAGQVRTTCEQMLSKVRWGLMMPVVPQQSHSGRHPGDEHWNSALMSSYSSLERRHFDCVHLFTFTSSVTCCLHYICMTALCIT